MKMKSRMFWTHTLEKYVAAASYWTSLSNSDSQCFSSGKFLVAMWWNRLDWCHNLRCRVCELHISSLQSHVEKYIH